MNGWIEPQEQIDLRSQRRLAREIAVECAPDFVKFFEAFELVYNSEEAEIGEWLQVCNLESIPQQYPASIHARDPFPQYERTEEEARDLTKRTYGASVTVSPDWLRRHL